MSASVESEVIYLRVRVDEEANRDDVLAAMDDVPGEVYVVETRSAILERDHYIRLFNRLEAAVRHHEKNIWGDQPVHHDEDRALYKARDRILADAGKAEQ